MYKSEILFTSGLLHDFGKIPLAFIDNDTYRMIIIDSSKKGIPLLDLENDYFGITHTQVGLLLAEKWNLPKEIKAAMGNHHLLSNEYSPDQSTECYDLIYYIHIANNICKKQKIGESGNSEFTEISDQNLEWFNVNISELDKMLDNLKEELVSVDYFWK